MVLLFPDLFDVACFTDVDQADHVNIVGYPDHDLSIVNHGIGSVDNVSHSPPPVTEHKENKTSLFNIQQANISSIFNYSIEIPARHPCENFSLPPVPFDPKRTGPRRKFYCHGFLITS